MLKNDLFQSFIFEHANIRGYLVNLTHTYQTIIAQHAYPSIIQRYLGEALVSCVFLSAGIKFNGNMSLQFQGNHHLPLLVAQCDNNLNLRATANFDIDATAIELEQAFNQGVLSLIVNHDAHPTPYRSMMPIHSNSIAQSITNFFQQSEQLVSQVWLATSDATAAGLILQRMPEKDAPQEEAWHCACTMAQTLTQAELLTLDNATLLHRLFHETDVRVFPSRTIQFKCRCNLDKMKSALYALGEAQAKQHISMHKTIEITCDFCRQNYYFDAVDVMALFHPNRIEPTLDKSIDIINEINLLKDVKK